MSKKDFQVRQKVPKIVLNDTINDKNTSSLLIPPVNPLQSSKSGAEANKLLFTFNIKNAEEDPANKKVSRSLRRSIYKKPPSFIESKAGNNSSALNGEALPKSAPLNLNSRIVNNHYVLSSISRDI